MTNQAAVPPLPGVAPEKSRSRRSRRSLPGQVLVWLLLGVLGLATLLPFVVTFVLALSPVGEPTLPLALPRTLTLDNVVQMLSSKDIVRWTVNSLVYSVVSTVIVLITACMAGYAFAKKRFPGSRWLMWAFLATLMVPVQTTLIPQFVLVSWMGGINTMWGLLVPTLANSQAVFLMRQFIVGLPDEIFDSARIDGAGEWRVFTSIVLPMSKPIMATLGIFVFLWHWNDFLWPLVVAQQSSMRTLTVGLASMNGEAAQLPLLMASAAITVVPCLVIFAVLQRYLVGGIAAGAIKG